MKLGLFMMPLHDPGRPYGDVLRDDREAILLADRLGYDEAWVGEHYSCATEPIPDPLQFMATLIHQTKAITFATGVINLPQHHPAQVAGNVALFDHLCQGRYVMGVGPGGLGSDFELFKTFGQEPLGDDGGGGGDHPQDLGLRPALPHPGQALGHHHRCASASPTRHRADAEALPAALPAARGLGHEPGLEHRPARRRARLGAGLGQLHAGRARQDPLGAVLRRGRGRGPPARPRRSGGSRARSWSPRATRRRRTTSPTTPLRSAGTTSTCATTWAPTSC